MVMAVVVVAVQAFLIGDLRRERAHIARLNWTASDAV
jgi:hypothetical protein